MSLAFRAARHLARSAGPLHQQAPSALSTSFAHACRGPSRTRLRAPALLLCASSAATAAVLAPARSSCCAFAEYSTAAATAAAAAAPAAVAAATAAAPEIVLYQYEVCPFSNKVRAFLDFHGIPYRVVEVDPLRKTELAKFDAEYRKVPIALVDGNQVNGSAAIVEHVRGIVGAGGKEPTEAERRWLHWLDDHLIHLIAPNIYRSPTESLQTFQYIADNAKFSAWERGTIRYSGAAAMYFVGKKLKKKYGIEDERRAMKEALKEWTDAVKESGGKFLGDGGGPGVADLSIYGVLKSIETFDTWRDIRGENAELAEWFDRTKAAVGEEAVTQRD